MAAVSTNLGIPDVLGSPTENQLVHTADCHAVVLYHCDGDYFFMKNSVGSSNDDRVIKIPINRPTFKEWKLSECSKPSDMMGMEKFDDKTDYLLGDVGES